MMKFHMLGPYAFHDMVNGFKFVAHARVGSVRCTLDGSGMVVQCVGGLPYTIEVIAQYFNGFQSPFRACFMSIGMCQVVGNKGGPVLANLALWKLSHPMWE
jgi:hypothetical protein